MRTVILSTMLVLIVSCTSQTSGVIDSTGSKEVHQDRWTLLNVADGIRVAVIHGDRPNTYAQIHCAHTEPHSATLTFFIPRAHNAPLYQTHIFVEGDETTHLLTFTRKERVLKTALDIRNDADRSVLEAFTNSTHPVAVDVVGMPEVRFKPGNGVIKTMFAECHDAQPLSGS